MEFGIARKADVGAHHNTAQCLPPSSLRVSRTIAGISGELGAVRLPLHGTCRLRHSRSSWLVLLLIGRSAGLCGEQVRSSGIGRPGALDNDEYVFAKLDRIGPLATDHVGLDKRSERIERASHLLDEPDEFGEESSPTARP